MGKAKQEVTLNQRHEAIGFRIRFSGPELDSRNSYYKEVDLKETLARAAY